MSKILVTGGAGYIGSILVPVLLDQGHRVTVIDNFLYQQDSLNHCCANDKFDIIRGDVRDQSLIKKHLTQCDIVIPLAALVGAPLCDRDPINATTTNKNAIFSMMDMLSHDQLVIMPTTNSAYGHGDANNFCDETSPLNPISRYARDKVEVEQRLMQYQNAISLRLATVFGMSPRMRTDLLVNDFVYRAVKDRTVILFEGHYKRNYIHIRDVAKAFIFSIENSSVMLSNIYNVGLSDANISKIELCQLIKNHIPDFKFYDHGDGKDPDQRNYIVSNAKIESLGYKPTSSLDDGIRELIKGYTMISNVRYGNTQ